MNSNLASYRRMVGLMTLSQGINFLFPLLTLPLLVRNLGTTAFGSYSVLFGLIALVQVLTEFGYAIHGVRTLAASQSASDARTQFNIIIAAKLLLCALAFPVFLLAVWFYGDSAIAGTAALIAYAFALGSCLNPTWYFIARKSLLAYTLASALSKLLSFAALRAWVAGPNDLPTAIAVNAMGNLALGLLSLGIAHRSLKSWEAATLRTGARTLPTMQKILHSLRETRHLFLANIGVSLYTSINVVLIGFVGGSTAAGQFSAAERIVKAIQQLLASLSTAALPIIASADQGTDKSKLQANLLTTQVKVFTTAALLIGLGAPYALELLYGRADPVPLTVLRILSAVILLGGISSALNNQVVAAAGRYKDISRIVMIGGGVNVVLAYIFAQAHGAIGSAIAVVSTECVILLLTWLAANSIRKYQATDQQ